MQISNGPRRNEKGKLKCLKSQEDRNNYQNLGYAAKAARAKRDVCNHQHLLKAKKISSEQHIAVLKDLKTQGQTKLYISTKKDMIKMRVERNED